MTNDKIKNKWYNDYRKEYVVYEYFIDRNFISSFGCSSSNKKEKQIGV